MTNEWNPPPSFYALMALACRCCDECVSVPCDGVCAGGMCDQACSCADDYDDDYDDESTDCDATEDQ